MTPTDHLAHLGAMLVLCLLLARLYFYLVKPEQEPDAETPRVPGLTPVDHYIRQLREAKHKAGLQAADDLLRTRPQRRSLRG